MLIINNNYDASAKISYNSGCNNYISPRPKLELMTDKFFGAKINSRPNALETINSRSNINNKVLNSKIEKSTDKTDDKKGLDSYKSKLNLLNNGKIKWFN